ncbi:MAG TPA: FAD-binding oxidoreductase [Geminicoccus sp.]|uniref:NAD(P)/FAD-dependent oxidoreductase n=1 Tax=Geminicoccus sp. TaxID=2024832 RepID=UPI002E34BA1B|nr:FAD-binding oxidoreductase [Geminicoccus sp.]HEX2525332.1 FAD-binding oxidoreductase [Geminicoccus sp.]
MAALIGSRIYDDAIYATDEPVPSLWEATAGPPPADDGPLVGESETEVAVIGGGIAGLSLVWHLTRRHGIAATALDAAKIGWGASGRNGGFVSMGYTKRSLDDLTATYGAEDARTVFEAQKAACAYVIDVARSENLDVDLSGRGEFIVAHKPDRLKGLAAKSSAMRSLFGEDWPVISKDELRARGYAGPEAHGAIYVPHGTGLHPLKYTYGLLQLARSHGGKVHPQSAVVHWERDGAGAHVLHIQGGGRLKAKTVVVATNGFTTEGLDGRFDGVTLPALSNILVTRPLSEAERQAQGYTTDVPVADSRNLLFYIRLLKDGRLLFGGRGGTSATKTAGERYWAYMHKRLQEVFPAWKDVEISHRWRGFVCLTADLVGRVGLFPQDRSTGFLFGCHGSGVAMSGYAAKFLASEIAGAGFNEPFPMCFRRPPVRFPVPSLRVPALAAAYAWYRIKDEILPA